MALLPILTAPDPRLKKKAKPVAKVDDGVRTLMADMLATMYAAPGVGLAAPQVGVSLRVIVLDVAREGEPPAPMKLVNPEIVWASDDDNTYEEGCLSVPGFHDTVSRPAHIRVRALDRHGVPFEIEPQGLLAVCIQHECDHLNGRLFVDYLSDLKRGRIRQKLEKQHRQQKTGHER